MPIDRTERTFTKDGRTQTVNSPTAAVSLKFQGWSEVTASDPAPAEQPESVSQAAAEVIVAEGDLAAAEAASVPPAGEPAGVVPPLAEPTVEEK